MSQPAAGASRGDQHALAPGRNGQAAALVLVAAGVAITGAVALLRFSQVLSD